MTEDLSGGCQKLAEQLDESDSDVLVRAGNPESDLHDERDRIAEYDVKESH